MTVENLIAEYEKQAKTIVLLLESKRRQIKRVNKQLEKDAVYKKIKLLEGMLYECMKTVCALREYGEMCV